MIKVLLVDDDLLVRNYLKQLISWEQYGYVIVGDYKNGKEAYKAVYAEDTPDIIITDVCMPVMNGIDLIEELKKVGNQARIIVLSCHDDFQYVKRALQFGADEYILKNELTEKTLLDVLQKVSSGIVKSEKKPEDLNWLLSFGEKKLQQDFVTFLFSGYENNIELGEYLEQLKINADFNYYEMILISSKKKNQSILPDSFLSIGLDILRQGNYSLAVEFYGIQAEDWVLFLIDFHKVNNLVVEKETIRKISEKIESMSRDYFSIEVENVTSGLIQKKKGFFHCFFQLQCRMRAIFYGVNVREIEMNFREDQFKGLPYKCDEIITYLENCTLVKNYESYVDQIIFDLKNLLVDPKLVFSWVNQIGERLLEREMIEPSEKVFYGIEDVRDILYKYGQCINSSQIDEDSVHPSICSAKEYIAQHYHENLSLNVISNAVYLSPAYFSALFKNEVGISFSKYLLKYRIEKVKGNLNKTTKKLKDIAEAAGFFDYQHFCKVFRVVTGKSPKQYREDVRMKK